MMQNVVLVGLVGHADTESARKRLAAVPSIEQSFYPCPASFADEFGLPFVRDQRGRSYFGLAAIDSFIAECRALDERG